MYRIQIPENIQTKDPLSGQPGEWIPWKRWFLMCVLNDQRMGSRPVELARVVKLVDKLSDERACAPGKSIDVEDDDYTTAKPIVESPQVALGGPVLMAQLLAFPRAFLAAQHVNDLKAKAEKK